MFNYLLFALMAWLFFRVWWGWHQSLRVANFRADIFALRRKLFILMATEKLDPTMPAYAGLRSLLNGLLSIAEDVTPFNVIAWSVFLELHPLGPPRLIGDLQKVEDVKLRREIGAIHVGVNKAINAHIRSMAVTSPTLWFAMFAFSLTKAKRALSSAVEVSGEVRGAVTC